MSRSKPFCDKIRKKKRKKVRSGTKQMMAESDELMELLSGKVEFMFDSNTETAHFLSTEFFGNP